MKSWDFTSPIPEEIGLECQGSCHETGNNSHGNSLDSADPALLQREGESQRPKLVLLLGVTGAGWTLGAAPAAFQRPMEFPGDGIPRGWNSRGMEFPGMGGAAPCPLLGCRNVAIPCFQSAVICLFNKIGKNPTFLTLKPARLSLGNLPRRRVPEFQGSGMSADPAGREQSRENGIIPLPVPGPAKPFLESFIPNPSSHPAPSSRPPGTARTFPNPAWDSFSRREFRNSLRP